MRKMPLSFKKFVSFFLLLILGAALGVYLVGRFVFELGPVVVKKTYGSLEFVVRLEKNFLNLGETFIVNYTLTNTGDGNVTLVSRYEDSFGFVLYNASFHEIYEHYTLYELGYITYKDSEVIFSNTRCLKPGECLSKISWVESDFWWREIEMAPGVYYMVAQTTPFCFDKWVSGNETVIKTDPVKINFVTPVTDAPTTEVVSSWLPLKLAMRLEKTTFQISEKININFSLTNVGVKNVSLEWWDRNLFDLLVYEDAYRLRGFGSLDGLWVGWQKWTLRPGESIASGSGAWSLGWDQKDSGGWLEKKDSWWNIYPSDLLERIEECPMESIQVVVYFFDEPDLETLEKYGAEIIEKPERLTPGTTVLMPKINVSRLFEEPVIEKIIMCALQVPPGTYYLVGQVYVMSVDGEYNLWHKVIATPAIRITITSNSSLSDTVGSSQSNR